MTASFLEYSIVVSCQWLMIAARKSAAMAENMMASGIALPFIFLLYIH